MDPCRAQKRPLGVSRGQLWHVRAPLLLEVMRTLLPGLVSMPVVAVGSREWREVKQQVILPKGLSAHASLMRQEKAFAGHFEPAAAPAFTPWK